MPKNNKKNIKFFDRSQALQAMYELKNQGFLHPKLEFQDDDTLILKCGNNLKTGSYPDIENDDIANWATDGERNDCKYWWIFD